MVEIRTPSFGGSKVKLTTERIEQWHALRMMIGFCREEAEALGADFLVYCLDLGIIAADDHMRDLEFRAAAPVCGAWVGDPHERRDGSDPERSTRPG